jgi:two-component system chemotaxis sensor kinase CheA
MAPDPYKYFRVEACDLVDQLGQGLLALERKGSGGEIVPRLLRLAHTLKGAARVVRQPEIADHAHAIEGVLSPFRELAGTVPQENVDAILRLVDAITGRIAALEAPEPAAEEGAVLPDKSAPPPEETFRPVRTDVDEIDDLLDGVTEAYAQVSALRDVAGLAEKARRLSEHIAEQLAGAAKREIDHPASRRADRLVASVELLRGFTGQLERGIAATHERVDRELRQVRDAAEQLRLIPAGALFSNFERAARDSARALGKEVAFEGKGGDIRLDAHVVRVVQNAVLQMVRNAAAHGIEAPRDRIAAGKPAQGNVSITVMRRGRQVVFRCEDDGRGIDVAALREAARRKGRLSAELDRLDAGGLAAVLLQGGISTSTVISEVAGRGIGMDIVRAAVAKLGANFVVATEPGKGTSFELIMPLSVSSVEALVVEGAGVTATIPLYAVSHTLRIEVRDIHRTSLGEAIIHDGRAVPLVSLARLLGQGTASRRGGSLSAIVVTAPAGFAAISVDRLLGTSNTIFRMLPELAPATTAIAGASLDVDGSPLLMLDPDGLVAMALCASEPYPEVVAMKRPLLVIDDSLTTRMLEQSILESAGYEVDMATSGEEGLEQARRTDYALILIDVEMPGMDGFTFIEQIRRDPKLHGTPTILITSRNAPEDKRRGQEVGAQGYIVKSEFDQAELLDHIKRLVA